VSGHPKPWRSWRTSLQSGTQNQGVFNFNTLTSQQMSSVLRNIPTEEVWGIGRKLTAALNDMGIVNVLQLRDADVPSLRKRFGVVMEKTIRELRGEACIEFEDVTPSKQQIINSRSFGNMVTELADLEDALSHFVSNAARNYAIKTLLPTCCKFSY
jgi:DNA polymerase V